MSDSTPPPGAPAPLRTCENCGTALQGGYCHLCGQSEHSPVRSLGHAIEEVFESFWHLDGRVFRTLRELWAPGRVADQYLAGHRVRYVAPMRLFVILTALTFFVAQFLVGSGDTRPAHAAGDTVRISDSFERIDSIAEVERVRDRALADLAQARTRLPRYMPGLDAGIVSAEGTVRRQAADRIAQLRREGAEEPAADDGVTEPETEPGDAEPADSAQGAEETPPPPAEDAPPGPDTAPQLDIEELIETQIEGIDRFRRNAERIGEDPRAFFRALLGAAPMTLFITVPLFAVMLKLLYFYKRRLYLEHVVVGLYSHAWLMLALLLYFLSVLAGGWLAPRAAWTAAPLSWLQSLLVLAMPLYLLWMQKRVYGQSWPVTLLKYCVIGVVYMSLFMTVALFMAAYVLYRM